MQATNRTGWIYMSGTSPIKCTFSCLPDGHVGIHLGPKIVLSTNFQLMSDEDVWVCRRTFQNERLVTAKIVARSSNATAPTMRSRLIGSPLRTLNN